MANVLAELFGDIADAIREKTGSTEKIAPANFPNAIREIEGTGGGSESTKLYWDDEPQVPISPKEQYVRTFVFKSELYMTAVTSTDFTYYDPARYKLYKYNNGTWESVGSWGGKIPSYEYATHEINGVMHFFGGYSKYHYTWDGTTFNVLDDLTYSTGWKSVVFNGYIYAINNDDNLYKYDLETGTSTVITTATAYENIIVRESRCFVCTSSKLYEIINDALVEVETTELGNIPFSAMVKDYFIVEFNNAAYVFDDGVGGVCKYKDGETIQLADVPFYLCASRPFTLFGDKVFFAGVSGGSSSDNRRVFSMTLT